MERKRVIIIFSLLFLSFFLLMPRANALSLDTPQHQPYVQKLKEYKAMLLRFEEELNAHDLSDSELSYFRIEIRNINRDLLTYQASTNKEIEQARDLLNQWGEKEVIEADQGKAKTVNEKEEMSFVAQVRKFKEKIQYYKGHSIKINLLLSKSKELLEKISTLRIKIRAKEMSEKQRPLYRYSAWKKGAVGFYRDFVKLFDHYAKVEMKKANNWSRFVHLASLGAALLVYFLFSGWLVTFLFSSFNKKSGLKKLLFWATYTLFKGVIPAILILPFVYYALQMTQETKGIWLEFWVSVGQALACIILFYSAFHALFMKKLQIMPKEIVEQRGLKRKAFVFLWILSLIAFFNSMNFFSFYTDFVTYFTPPTLVLVNTLLGILLVYALMVAMPHTAHSIRGKSWSAIFSAKWREHYRILRTFIFLVLLVYPVASFFGYVNFANVYFMSVIQCVMLFVIFIVFHISFKELFPLFCRACVKLYYRFNPNPEVNKRDIKTMNPVLLYYWSGVIFDVCLLFVTILCVLLIWGVQPEVLQDWLHLIIFKGIPISNHANFSLFYIFRAVLTFAITFYVGRFVLKMVERHVLPYTKWDVGSQQAIKTTIGYLILAIAIVLFFYALGINVTALTIVLSGLTFGIGFGMQEFFKNFVAGFILLIERPIKIGDLVIVNDILGTVKRIRLRATEVETFDKTVLVIPNSDLVVKPISNDLANPISRVAIETSCAYTDDPEKVRDVLLKVAKAHETVLKKPDPSVVFDSFGDSGLIFKLRVYTKTADRLQASSDLKFKIFKAFQEAGIEIPYPKRDLYLKEMPENIGTPVAQIKTKEEG